MLYVETAANNYGKNLLDLINKQPQASDSDIRTAAGKDGVISAPRATLFVGTETRMYMSYGDIQYFEETGNGRFALKTTIGDTNFNWQGITVKPGSELSPGIRLSMMVNDTGKANFVTVNYLLGITTFKERKKIPETELDVGRPVMMTAQTDETRTLELDKWLFSGKQLTFIYNNGNPVKTGMLLKVCQIHP